MLLLNHPLVQEILAPLLEGILGIFLAWAGNQLPGRRQASVKLILASKLAVEVVLFLVIFRALPDALRLLQESTDKAVRGIGLVFLVVVGIFLIQIGWDIVQLRRWSRR